jgi:hypothetical protein
MRTLKPTETEMPMKRSDMMRCPNCSFLNPDDADECKICGYELTPSTSDPASEQKKKSKHRFDDDEDLDKTVDALFGEMAPQSKHKPKEKSKRVDKRFEAYAEMPEAEDEPISEDELRWLERLQRDIKQVDDEFDRLRHSAVHPDAKQSDSDNLRAGAVAGSTVTDYLSEAASPDLAEDTKVFKGEQTFDTYKFKPAITEVEASDSDAPDEIPEGTVSATASFEMPAEPSVNPSVNPSAEAPAAMPDAPSDEEHDEPLAASMESPVDNTDEMPIHPQSVTHTVDGEEVIHLNFTVSEAAETAPAPKAPQILSQDEDADIDYEALDEDPNFNPNAHRNRMIILFVLLIILVIIFFKMFIRTTPETASSPEDTTPAVETPVETESPSEAIAEQTGIFFGQLQSYVNNGNIAVLSMFADSQNALEQLAAFKARGTLDDFTLSMPDTIDVTDSKANVDVVVTLNRTIDGAAVQSDSTWSFSWEEADTIWHINTLVIASQDGSTTVDNSSTSNSSGSSTSSSGATTSSSTSTATTTAEKPEGFIATGTFTGGIITDGQDISGIRFGKHELFERVVLDLSAWTGGTPTERVDEACHYDAKISDDGKTITITLSGARGVSAGTPDLTRSTYFKSVTAYFPEDDSMVGFTIELNQASEYKVFSLKSPGKIVIDVMPK